MKNKDVVCFSTHYWNEPWFRKQQFMLRFSENNRVLYVEPSFSIIRKPHHDFCRNQYLKPILYEINNNLWVLTPPRHLPKMTSPFFSNLNNYWQAIWANMVINQLDFKDIVLWLYWPTSGSLQKYIKHGCLIFDICDNYFAYNLNDSKNSLFVRSCTEKLIHNSDYLIFTTKSLQKKYGGGPKENIVIQNGVDTVRFSPYQDLEKTEISHISNPIIGFIGVLFKYLDYPKIERTIIENPNYEFIFIGRIEDNVGVNMINKYPNVRLLGYKSPSKIPHYLANFDVCLNPFKIDEVGNHVSPLKIFEYMAMGKPIVSSTISDFKEFLGIDHSTLIYWSNPDEDNYTDAINNALKEESYLLREKRRAFAEDNSWDKLFQKLDQFLEI